MYSSQTQPEEQSFNDERAVITSELHDIVDNLQLNTPQDEPPRRPFWQRPIVWQVPLCLIALAIIVMYNSRMETCNGFKITYNKQILCISNDADFFLFVENFTCDFIEKGRTVMDSLQIDDVAQPKMNAYFEKHNFSIEKAPIEAEVLRGMRGTYDSTSFCVNLTKAYWNAGISLLKNDKKDSACYYFNKIEAWSWGDSVLTAADKSVISDNCYDDLLKFQLAQQMAFEETNQDTAKGLNNINNTLKNINSVFQNRINQRENKNRIVPKIEEKKPNILNKNSKNNVIKSPFVRPQTQAPPQYQPPTITLQTPPIVPTVSNNDLKKNKLDSIENVDRIPNNQQTDGKEKATNTSPEQTNIAKGDPNRLSVNRSNVPIGEDFIVEISYTNVGKEAVKVGTISLVLNQNDFIKTGHPLNIIDIKTNNKEEEIRGRKTYDSGELQWKIGYLAPNETKTIVVKFNVSKSWKPSKQQSRLQFSGQITLDGQKINTNNLIVYIGK